MTTSDGGTERRQFTPDFLTELFRNPLDPGYADAAARRARDGAPTGWSKWCSSAASLVTLVGLGMLLVVAYRQTVADEPARTQARGALVEQVLRKRVDTDAQQVRADRLRRDVATLRERELGAPAVARLRDLEAATGLARVRGDGAKITLRDGPTPISPVTGLRDNDGRVKDSDLQLAANALWAGGAEAIAVNGQRLTATSTIRQAGEAILVDFRPVASPYEVIAIGPDQLSDDFRDDYAGRFFRQLVSKYGMSFDVTEVQHVTLEAAGEPNLRFAQPSTPAPLPSDTSPGDGTGKPSPHTTSSSGATSSVAPLSTPSEGG